MPRAPYSSTRFSASVAATGESCVPVNVDGVTRDILLQEIRQISSCENYTEVFSGAGRLLVRRTMQQWTELLPSAQFVRVHRGLIVNIGRLAHFERRATEPIRVHFDRGDVSPLEIKRRHWPALRRRIEQWRAQRPRPSPVEKSIAVLPFVNFSAKRSDEIFCDGITEELINVLAKIPALHVAARTSAFHFRNKNLPVAQIATQLGVRYVVEGSVRRSRGQIRITSQLIDAANGFHVWSDAFDRYPTDIFAAQDEIAAIIARTLELKLGAPRRAAVNADAQRLAIEGRHYWNLRTEDGFARAEKAFANAIVLEPDFAAPHASLADLSVVRAMYRLADGERDAADDLRRARAAAVRALELDPTLGEPHAALGFACVHEGRLAEAEPHFRRAFIANPNYATGYQFFAWTLATLGRLDEGLAEYTRAIALDPLSFINLDRYGAMLMLAGRPTQALEASERAAALRPDLFVGNVSQRAPILLALGRTDEAISAARKVRELSPSAPFRRNSDSDAIFVLQQSGCEREAADYAAEMLQRFPRGNYLRGFVLAAIGRHEEAWAELSRTPAIMLPQLYWSPLWATVRGTTGFRRLIRELGREREFARARDPNTRMPA